MAGPAAGPDLKADTPPSTPLPTGRGIELVLLAFAAVLMTSALTLVEANEEKGLKIEFLYVGAAYLGLFTIAHLAVRKLAPYADPLILPCVALLNGLGLVMIHRIDLAQIDKAIAKGREVPQEVLSRQVAWTALGVVLFVAILWFVRDHRSLARYAYTAGLAGIVALILPAVPGLGAEINGSPIWIKVGPFTIQPGEFAKILLIVFFAAFLVSKRELFSTAGRKLLGMELPRARDLAPLLVAWGLSVGVLVLEQDLGTSLLSFAILLMMLYVATERISWVVIGLSFFAVGAFAAYQLFLRVRTRVENWLDPFADYNDTGRQLSESMFGLGTGGVGGTGLGAGRPDLVPLPESDYMLASLGEELGLIGLAAILMVYLVLITRGMRSSLAVRDSFGKLLACGLAFTVAIQIFVVIGGTSRLIPVTGLVLPFLAYGGSALLANYVLVALLLRISNAARAPLPRKPAQPKPSIAEAGTVLVKKAT